VSTVLIVILALAVAVLAVVVSRQHRRLKTTQTALSTTPADLIDKLKALELESAKSRLNPHLLRNALNAIQSHAYQTYYALDKLSNVLDYILYESDRRFVTPREEVDFALSLIEINRLKVSPLFDLQVKNKLDATYDKPAIAPLITIDLIENAFKHADLQREGAFISILFELKDDRFTLTVSNKVSAQPPLRKEKGGVGRATLRTRLDALYPGRYELEQFLQDDIFTARLSLRLS